MFETAGLVHSHIGWQAEERIQAVGADRCFRTEITKAAPVKATAATSGAESAELTGRESARVEPKVSELVAHLAAIPIETATPAAEVAASSKPASAKATTTKPASIKSTPAEATPATIEPAATEPPAAAIESTTTETTTTTMKASPETSSAESAASVESPESAALCS